MLTAKKNVKILVLIPIGAAILTLLASSIVAIYWFQRKNIEAETRQSIETVQAFFQGSLEQDAESLNGLIDCIQRDENLQKEWLNKNRGKLLDLATPIFEEIRPKYGVTHFYFHSLEKVCFLRVHQPLRFGDYINRFTLDEAIRQSNPVWGIELGPLGTFTLRTVHPWFIDGNLVGYLELGKEIEHIMPMLKKYVGVDLIFIINKSFLNREGWEEGMKMMRRSGNWDFSPNSVVTDSTLRDIPKQLSNNFAVSHTLHKNNLYITSIENRTYQSGFVQLFDAGGREVGNIIVLKDITTNRMQLQALSLILIALGIITAFVMFGVLYTSISHIELKLILANKSLDNEIKKRKEIEAELRDHWKQIEDTAQKQTQELQKTTK